MQTFNAIGLMSGTSLDGLDIAYCKFEVSEFEAPAYQIIYAKTIDYSKEFKIFLKDLENYNTTDFLRNDRYLGTVFGNYIKDFIKENKITKVDFVASHGHTVFHQPNNGFTVQVGNGANIAAQCKLPVVCDFRSLDVALGGQGAPLVPLGDYLLFNSYSHCLNLGGIANISFQNSQNERIAFDICPCNMPLNFIIQKIGKNYDDNGILAAQGKVNFELFNKLNELEFYKKSAPKSLGKEWVDAYFMPLILNSNLDIKDLLSTLCEHIAYQISIQIKGENLQLFITGGGAFNGHLISRIKHYSKVNVIIPDEKIINFKEALIFAWLGVLRWQNKVNTLSSVTGATKNSVGGCIYWNS